MSLQLCITLLTLLYSLNFLSFFSFILFIISHCLSLLLPSFHWSLPFSFFNIHTLTLNLLCQFALPSKVSIFFIHISINLFHFLYFSFFICIINIFGTKKQCCLNHGTSKARGNKPSTNGPTSWHRVLHRLKPFLGLVIVTLPSSAFSVFIFLDNKS
jgi:hypothetical protein